MARKTKTAAPPKAPPGAGGMNCFILGTLATSAKKNLESARKDFVAMRFNEAARLVSEARKDISIIGQTLKQRDLANLVRKVERETATLEVEMRDLALRPPQKPREAFLLRFSRVMDSHDQVALKIASEQCGVPLPQKATVRPKGPPMA